MAYKKPENVAGLISNEDGRFLHDYAAGVPDGMCIVEIGPFTGKSTVFLAQGASDSVVVYTYDLWEDNHRPITGGGTQIVQDRTDSHKVFIDNIKKCGVNNKVFPAKYDSAKAGKEWPDDSMPIGLIYIDGGWIAMNFSTPARCFVPALSPSQASGIMRRPSPSSTKSSSGSSPFRWRPGCVS